MSYTVQFTSIGTVRFAAVLGIQYSVPYVTKLIIVNIIKLLVQGHRPFSYTVKKLANLYWLKNGQKMDLRKYSKPALRSWSF